MINTLHIDIEGGFGGSSISLFNLIALIDKKKFKPHTIVKGGDYEGKKVVGEDIVNKLVIVKFEDGKSTTRIINKIQQGKK